MLKENWEAFKEFCKFVKSWSKTGTFIVITTMLYLVLFFYLAVIVEHRDALEIAQLFYVLVLTVGLVIVYTVKNRRR